MPDTLDRPLSQVEREAFGRRLQTLRMAAGKSRKELAEAIGVPVRTIEGWEQGRREAGALNVPDIVEFLGCTYDELFTEPDRRKEKPLPRGRPRKPADD